VIQIRHKEPVEGHFLPGDLVQHRRYGYRGVVVAADASCRASEAWYGANQTQPAREQPWYHVLVHAAMHSTYAAEDSLLPDPSGEPVSHPLLGRFFSGFKDGRHVRNGSPFAP